MSTGVDMLAALLLALTAQASPLAGGAVILTFDAYGERIQGELVVDAGALASHGITIDRAADGTDHKTVPVVYGMRFGGEERDTSVVEESTDAIRALDHNQDGYLDASDPTFSAVRLFVDRNGDREAQPDELRPLDDLGVVHISRFGEIRLKERVVPE